MIKCSIAMHKDNGITTVIKLDQLLQPITTQTCQVCKRISKRVKQVNESEMKEFNQDEFQCEWHI